MAEPKAKRQSRDGSSAGTEAVVRLADRFEVFTDSPLHPFDTPAGPAFQARSLRSRKGPSYAVVTDGSVPPRQDNLSVFNNFDPALTVTLLDWGVVDWPGNGDRRLAFIFDRPGGRALMRSLTEPVQPLSEEVLTRAVIRPIAAGLREFISRGPVHGGIRPTNLFYRDTTSASVMLGECVTAPPGYGQGALFETIERAMAHPAGRGPGTALDDLYALGVTILCLALGRHPQPEMDEDAIITAKIERGSYPALVGNNRLPANLVEPVRGLLGDDPRQRWTLNQVDLWLSGRRLSPKQPQIARRASRPFVFGEDELWNTRTLARALIDRPSAAQDVLESGEVDKWLRRSLSDEGIADAVAESVKAAGTTSGQGVRTASQAERHATRAALALDPPAPIRYKRFSVMPDGIGTTLAYAFLRSETYQPLAEIIALQLPLSWANQQPELRPEQVPLIQTLDGLRANLDRMTAGYGIERILYELNRTLPCLSTLVRSRCALTAGDLLLALDAVPVSADRPREPMDRHIAAFLAARHRRLDDALYGQLAANVDPVRRTTAIMTFFSDIQLRTGNPSTPRLGHWLMAVMEPVVNRFHNRPHREKLRRSLESTAKEGNITEMLRLVDDRESIQKDAAEFERARKEHRQAVKEIERLRQTIAERPNIAATTGRQVAAVAASVVATVMVAILILGYLL